LVVVASVAYELSLEINDRGEYNAGNHTALDLVDLRLALIESRL
jgi:hypothetical protein